MRARRMRPYLYPAPSMAALRSAFGALPLTDPRFALREACKQSALLEQHLSEPERSCPDCIRKHFLLFEGHLEEALDLGARGEVRHAVKKALPYVRKAARAWHNGASELSVAQALRRVRKHLVGICFDAMGD